MMRTASWAMTAGCLQLALSACGGEARLDPADVAGEYTLSLVNG